MPHLWRDSMSKASHRHPKLAIETSGLVKVFGQTRAVDGVDLAVRTGTVYGLLGPNGACKTTTIRMLATLLRPDSGTARVFGRNVVREADAMRGLMHRTVTAGQIGWVLLMSGALIAVFAPLI